MQPKMIWANVAVKNLDVTTAFYTALGFKPNGSNDSPNLRSFLFGEKDFVIHFFREEQIKFSMQGGIADLKHGNEVMFSLSADTEKEVNDWAKNAKEAGGTIFFEAGRQKDGYYYCAFSDPDGHRFNVLLIEAGM
ncbi:MAG: VOC family protein [Ferruginibacter sp.]